MSTPDTRHGTLFRAHGQQQTHIIEREIVAAPGGWPFLLTYCGRTFVPTDQDLAATHGKYECRECYQKAGCRP